MWHDPTRNLLIYETQDPRPFKYIPEARPINGRYLALPVTLQNLQIMRILGYDVIRPLPDYDYPRHLKAIPAPFDSQIETVNFLAAHPRAYDLSDMGAGKTMSALWAADAIMHDSLATGQGRTRAIIAAPLSTLQSVWMDSLTTHFMGRRKGVIVYGSEKQRIAALAEDVDFYIINHDGIKVGARFIATAPRRPPRIEFTGFSAALAGRKDIRIAIIDEIGAFRDSRSDRSRIAKLILASRDYFWGLTGTPTPTSPVDAYGLGKLLNNCYGETITSFRQRTMLQLDRFKWVARRGAHEEAMKLLTPHIRFPVNLKVGLSIQDRDVPLSKEQKEWLRDLKRELLIEIGKDRIKASNSAVLRTKLLQICTGAVYDEDHNPHYLDVAPRLSVLREVIDEAGKVLVFTPFTASINILKDGLKKFSCEVIVGDTSPTERTRIMRAFQTEDKPRVILASAEPISRGQTLTAACVSVWWGPVDKCETYMQANKRIHRPGQTRNCTVVNLSGSAVEKEAYRRLAEQESMQGLLLKLAEMGI
jgi:SNF2 family DNA or RNA helicase